MAVRNSKKVDKPDGLIFELEELYFGGLKRAATTYGWPVKKPMEFLKAAIWRIYQTECCQVYIFDKTIADKLTIEDTKLAIEIGKIYLDSYVEFKNDYSNYYKINGETNVRRQEKKQNTVRREV